MSEVPHAGQYVVQRCFNPSAMSTPTVGDRVDDVEDPLLVHPEAIVVTLDQPRLLVGLMLLDYESLVLFTVETVEDGGAGDDDHTTSLSVDQC